MSNLIIVAIPADDDYVWRISSEKVPHLTLLYLEDEDLTHVRQIVDFLEHAARTTLTRFGLDVDRRGFLGPDLADVLFFSRGWELPEIRQFRSYLLQNTHIRTAYDSVEQYPEWQPHLTLGYPETPAKPDRRDYPGINWVRFDRIALWVGDYAGPEFRLKDYGMAVADDVYMSEVSSNPLTHYGIKGMRWGIRRKNPGTPSEVVVRTNPRRMAKTQIKTRGGRGLPASDDAVRAAISAQKARKSGPQSLTNRELQDLVTRMNLEQQYSRLRDSAPEGAARRFVREILTDVAQQQVRRLATEVVTRQVGNALVPIRR